jgi:hypothetical protein
MQTHGRLCCLTLFSILTWFAPSLFAATLDASHLPIVKAATFEVVLAKPDDSAVRYEKPLPLEKLPFQYRNDKYNSIGTAFAIGKNRFVTAFHVVVDGIGGRVGPPLLRDANGKVFAIDKVVGFSLAQDFVVFTVVDAPDVKPLAIDRGSHLNEVVYAVGNALGTGVVVRDGLYTSDTPEDENGQWKWIRFSAAASPGNSGGPLLDKDGKVIGVVLRKSPNENLNFALPIGLVLDAPASSVDSERRVSGRAVFMDSTQDGMFHVHLDLPLAFADFAKSYQSQADAFFDAQWKQLLTKEDANLFPKGDGSKKILASSAPLDAFPMALHRGANNEWSYWRPQHGKTPLPGNGFVDIGVLGKTALIHVRKPDDLSLAKLYSDATGLVDLIFKATTFTRDVGDEKVRMTSLGAPLSDVVFVDKWHRRWQHREYAIPAVDAVLAVYSLPVPDGYVVLLLTVPSRSRHTESVQTETLIGLVSATYDGSFAAWKEFLQQGEWVPADIAGAKLSIDYGKRFSIAPTGFSLTYGADLQPIEANGELTVSYGYLGRDGSATLGIAGVRAQPDMDKYATIRVNRHPKPFADSPRDHLSNWNDLVTRAHPEDGQPYKDGRMTWAGTTLGHPSAESDVLYTLFYGSDANPSDVVMKQRLAAAVKGATVNEH